MEIGTQKPARVVTPIKEPVPQRERTPSPARTAPSRHEPSKTPSKPVRKPEKVPS